MENETKRRSRAEGLQSLARNNGCVRPPPGLVDNLGHVSIPLKQDGGAPQSEIGPTSFTYPILPLGNNNGYYSFQPPVLPYPPMNYMCYDNNLPSTNAAAGELANGNHSVLTQQQSQTELLPNLSPRNFPSDRNSSGDSTARLRTASAGVIEPIIENLMGSMGNSDGTYSHFGPTNNPIVNGLSFSQGNQDGINILPRQNAIAFPPSTVADIQSPTTFHSVNTDPFNSTPEWEFQRKMESRIRQKQLLQKQQLSAAVPFGENNSTNVSAQTSSDGPRYKDQASSPSPKIDNSSSSHFGRSESSGKPSYLEMLTKNCKKDKSSASNAKHSGDSLDSNKEFSPVFPFYNRIHRKSLEGLTGLGPSSSPPASNPSTASSSPITKPRTQQKGKENHNGNTSSSAGSSKSSTRRNTPVVTPVHQQTNDGESVKKAQANKSSFWVTKLSGRVNGKNIEIPPAGNAKRPCQFEFELEDLDSPGDGFEDCGPKQALRQGNGEDKNAGACGNRKKAKRRYSSNGGWGVSPETGAQGNSNIANGSERRPSNSESKGGTSTNSSTANMYTGRRVNAGKEKSEKIRGKKEGRNCAMRRLRIYSEQWIAHLMNALKWLWMLLANVTVLSASLGYKLMKDLLIWWKSIAIPTFQRKLKLTKHKVNSAWKRITNFRKRQKDNVSPPKPGTYDEFLSILGPDRNILLPSTGDEALRRLLSVKGQDPYSILGVKSNSCEETIRRYYKKQAVLVHPDKNLTPGAEEAFKILAKAFEMVGEPEHRLQYHQQLLEAHAKERFIGEFGELFEELRKKMETACSTIRCTKCKGRHKKNKTSRPVFAARYCEQCRIHHAGREGELWAEKGGMFSFTWQFYACMGNQVWEINEWGRCQRSSLKHLKPNAHTVIYRLVSNGQQSGKGMASGGSGIPNGQSCSPPPPEDDLLDPEMEDWDSLFNNLYRTSGNATNNFSTNHKACSKGSTATGTTNYQCSNGTNSTVPGKRRKGKKK